jgi:hypothetical protein
VIVRYHLHRLTDSKKAVIKADMELLKANFIDKFSERLEKIKKDRELSNRIVLGIGRVFKNIGGVDIFGLTVQKLVDNVEMLSKIGVIDYEFVDKGGSDGVLTVRINKYLDEAEAVGIGMIDRFKSTKRLEEHIHKAVRESYTQKYEREVIEG